MEAWGRADRDRYGRKYICSLGLSQPGLCQRSQVVSLDCWDKGNRTPPLPK